MLKTTNRKLFKGRCQKCGDKLAPADSLSKFNRNRALHMRFRHGVRSKLTKKAAGRAKVQFHSHTNGTDIPSVTVAPRRKLGRPPKTIVAAESKWEGVELNTPGSLNRPARELRQIARIFVRASRLRLKLERTLSPYV